MIQSPPSPYFLDRPSGRVVAPGTPLARLQDVHEGEQMVLVGDVTDTCNCADKKAKDDKVVAKLRQATTGKLNGERVIVTAEDVAHVTNLILGA